MKTAPLFSVYPKYCPVAGKNIYIKEIENANTEDVCLVCLNNKLCTNNNNRCINNTIKNN